MLSIYTCFWSISHCPLIKKNFVDWSFFVYPADWVVFCIVRLFEPYVKFGISGIRRFNFQGQRNQWYCFYLIQVFISWWWKLFKHWINIFTYISTFVYEYLYLYLYICCLEKVIQYTCIYIHRICFFFIVIKVRTGSAEPWYPSVPTLYSEP
jgi:hypothetical protein